MRKRKRKVAKNNVSLSINEDTIIDYLQELAESFGVQIRYEIIKQDEDLSFVAGGLCLLKGKGKYVLIINPKATTKGKIKILAMAVKHFDLDQIYVRPILRQLLDRIPEQKPYGNSSDGSKSMTRI